MNQPLAAVLTHNRWANLELLEACRSLTGAQLDARAPGTSGPVRELLVHIVGGQQTFVLRTKGRQHEGELNRNSPWTGFETRVDIATRTSDELIAIAEDMDADTEVDLPFMGKTYRYPKSFFLVHAIEHGVEHRTEVKVTLASIGVATPDLDAWPWGADAGYGREV